jgi:hypothetical protein
MKSEEGALVNVYCLDVDTGASDDLYLLEDLLTAGGKLKEEASIGTCCFDIDTSNNADINLERCC